MEYYDVCRVLSTHGLKGELKVQVITDFPDQRFQAGSKLWLQGRPQPFTVKSGRPFKQFWLLSLAEITNITAAQKLAGQTLQISAADQQALPAGSYYYHDILGLDVIDAASGQKIGQICDIESPGANDIWQVAADQGQNFWLPYIPDVVKKVDLSRKQVIVSLMEGLRNED